MIHTDLVKLMEQAKKDFHKLVATKMFNVIYEDVTAEQRYAAKQATYIHIYSNKGGLL